MIYEFYPLEKSNDCHTSRAMTIQLIIGVIAAYTSQECAIQIIPIKEQGLRLKRLFDLFSSHRSCSCRCKLTRQHPNMVSPGDKFVVNNAESISAMYDS